MKVHLTLAFLVFYLATCSSVNCQTYVYTDARVESMANADITNKSAWNIFRNPSVLSNNNISEINIGYRIPYHIQELSIQSICGSFKTGNSSIGGGYTHSGSPLFNVQTGTLGFAHRLGAKINGGVALNLYTATLPDNIEKDYALSGDIGLTLYPSENINIGVSLKNISGSGFNEYKQEKIERQYITGLSYLVERFIVAASLKLNDQFNSTLQIGTEIFLVESFAIRAGATISELISIHAGAGYAHKFWVCDVAFNRHEYLGYTSNITIGFKIAAK